MDETGFSQHQPHYLVAEEPNYEVEDIPSHDPTISHDVSSYMSNMRLNSPMLIPSQLDPQNVTGNYRQNGYAYGQGFHRSQMNAPHISSQQQQIQQIQQQKTHQIHQQQQQTCYNRIVSNRLYIVVVYFCDWRLAFKLILLSVNFWSHLPS